MTLFTNQVAARPLPWFMDDAKTASRQPTLPADVRRQAQDIIRPDCFPRAVCAEHIGDWQVAHGVVDFGHQKAYPASRSTPV